MEMPRVRFTIRQMMVLTVVVAVLFCAAQTIRRRSEYLRLAKHCRSIAIMNELSLKNEQPTWKTRPWKERWAYQEFSRRNKVHYETLAREYEWAARHPWISIGTRVGGFSSEIQASEIPPEPK
jgi:hypothetical protein